MRKIVLFLILVSFLGTVFSQVKKRQGAFLSGTDLPKEIYWMGSISEIQLPDYVPGDYYDEYLKINIMRDTLLPNHDRTSQLKNFEIRETAHLPKGLTADTEVADTPWEDYIQLRIRFHGIIQKQKKIQLTLCIEFDKDTDGEVRHGSYTIDSIFIAPQRGYIINETVINRDIGAVSAYPNPFYKNTEISFWSKTEQEVVFFIKDVLGNTIFSRRILAAKGDNVIPFERGNFPSGMYIYTLKTKKSVISKRIVIR